MYIKEKQSLDGKTFIGALLFQHENTPHFTVEGNLNMY